jgi:hypothetical protein
MSQENVDIARRSIKHLNRTGRFLWELLDPQIEWTVDPIGGLLAEALEAAGLSE